jgi:hypothetical protein
MKKNTKKLVLNKETLRDLMAQNAGGVKGGDKSKMCNHTWVNCKPTKISCVCPSAWCTWGC